MRSIMDKAVNPERSRTHSNAQLHKSVANGTRPVTASCRNLADELPAHQTVQEQERLALLGMSAVVFAHELGNPLQAIFGCVELIESELKQKQIVDPFVTNMIQGAMREIDRLRALLREFRSFAKPQSLNLQPVDVERIIADVLALQRLGYVADGITVKLECEKPLPRVMLDATKMTQAILNLCINAVDAMPHGGCLSIRVYSSGPTVVVEVADNGVGVPDDINVFQLFKTTKPDGSGLGLPVVQQIVSAHNGTISYISEPGRGTTFFVHLPVENRNGSPV